MTPMKVRVNAEIRDVAEGITVDQLIRDLGGVKGPVAVELNREILPKAMYAEMKLSDGDQLEIVTFVGGG